MKSGKFIVVLFGLFLMISGSAAIAQDEGISRPDAQQVRICPANYDPVCGERYGKRKSFQNFCVAKSYGYRVLYGGKCRIAPKPPEPQVCPRIYAPVCAERRGVRQTFSNDCVAETRGYRVVYDGQCRVAPEPQGCPRIYAPVCAERNGNRQTFSNDCLAETRGYNVVYDGECRIAPRPPKPPRPEVCSDDYRPVCGERDGVRRTFSNVCEGKASGFRLLYDSACNAEIDPTQPDVQNPRKWYDR